MGNEKSGGRSAGMRRSVRHGIGVVLVFFIGVSLIAAAGSGQESPALPEVVDPGSPTQPPADAIVLFDGSNLDQWRHTDGRPAEWPVEGGATTVKRRTGGIVSTVTFADVQVHVEFSTPSSDTNTGQGRGNSGVYLQGRYEVQVLDSFQNDTYPNGQCGAIYGQHIPLVNVCRPPGQWQSYDIIFHPPLFDEAGQRTEPGTITVFHNGVLIQDHVELQGSTTAAMMREGPGDGPLYLQDHGDLVRYRNIWIRHLPGR